MKNKGDNDYMPRFEFRTGIYEGEAVDNIPNGKGKVIWKDGGYYEGEFLDGDFHGCGKAHLVGIGIYEGVWNKNDFTEGKFTAASNRLPNHEAGAIYEGTFDHFVLDGRGKMIRPNGEVHEGEFSNCRLNGNGKITFPDGKVIEGDFEDGVKKHEHTDEDYKNDGGDARFGSN